MPLFIAALQEVVVRAAVASLVVTLFRLLNVIRAAMWCQLVNCGPQSHRSPLVQWGLRSSQRYILVQFEASKYLT